MPINLDTEHFLGIVGAKRGGTTLFRRVMNSHSKISIPPPGWLHHFIKPYEFGYGDLSNEKNMMTMIQDALRIPMIANYWQVDDSPEQILKKLPEKSFRGLYYTLSQYYVVSTKKNPAYWGSKSPADAFWIREIQQDFPNAKFLFLYRDGRDTAMDLVNTIWAPFNHVSASQNWLRHIEAIQAAKEYLLPGSYMELRYEDFVKSPKENLIMVCQFLNIEFEESMLDFYKQSPDSFVTGAYHAKTNNPITDKYVGIYKNLSQHEQELQLGIMRDMLDRLGYQPRGDTKKAGFWESLRYLD